MSFRPATSLQHHHITSQSPHSWGQTKLVNSRLLTATPGRVGSVELSSDTGDRGLSETSEESGGEGFVCVLRLCVWHVVKMNLSIRHLE